MFMLILCFRNMAHSQATAPIKWGNSYVNLSKKTVGGPVMPGDTLEIRTNFYVNGTYNGTGKMFDVRYLDNVPTKTTILPNDSLRLVTNEGLTFRHYTYATGDDPGSYVAVPVLAGDFQIRINMGNNPLTPNGVDPMGTTNIAGASTIQGNVSKPLFGGGSIISTGFRVVVTGTYGDTITLGAGQIRYRQTAATLTDTVLKATQYKILITAPTTLCSSTTSTNFAAEFGGTFGTAAGRNRGVGPSFPIPNYAYLPNSGTAPSINDGYYAIVNNISPVSSTFPGAALMNSCAGFTGVNACSNREFNGFWDICGDHTGTTNSAGNPPPGNTTSAGYMLVVNADLATSEAYHQVIAGLCPNTYYQFSAWVKNICPNCGIDSNGTPEYLQGVLPNLTLVVDSIDRISTGQLDHGNGWQQRGFVFLTGPTETSITISIRNNAPGGGGNDWALDDITLATCPPSLLLTPDRPDTLCYGADDTVKFAISAFVNNFTEWQLTKSTDGGATWAPAGKDTLNRPDTGTVVPQYNPVTGLYLDTVTRYFQVPASTSTTIYRLTVASTMANLANSSCAYATTQPKYVVGVNCMIALPTSLLSFRGQLQTGGLANLQWTTTGEVQGLQFNVERSDDGVHYTTIATLPGTAVPGDGATYHFNDPAPVAAQSYYRIQLTSNSISQYSHLVLLSNTAIAFNVRSVQNPFIDQINMELTAPSAGTATITVIDLFGRSLRRVIQPVNQGLNSISLYGLGNLASATYALQIQYGDHLVSQKVVKVDK